MSNNHLNQRILLELAKTDYDPSFYGIIMGIITKMFHISIFILLTLHILQKSNKKRVFTFAPIRFIFVIYPLSTPWIAGSVVKNSYRYFNGEILQSFFKWTYNGYFNLGFLQIFKKITDSGGKEYTGKTTFGQFLYINSVFVEIIIFIILFIISAASFPKLKKYDLKGHLLVSISIVFFYCWSFYFYTLALLFLAQDRDLADLNNDGASYKRNNFGYILSYIFAILMILTTVFSIVWIYLKMFEEKDRKEAIMLRERKEEEEIRTVKQNLDHIEKQDYGRDLAYRHQPSLRSKAGVKIEIVENHKNFVKLKEEKKEWRKKLPEFEFLNAYVGVGLGLMHIENSRKAFQNLIPVTYNANLFLRYFVVITLSVLLRSNPKTLYWILLILDIIFLVLVFGIKETSITISFVLILMVEVFQILFHLAQLILFYDSLGDGDQGKFGSTLVWILTLVIFFSVISVILLEIALFVTSLKRTLKEVKEDVKKPSEENLNSLAGSSMEELGQNVNVYNTLKSKNLSRLDKNHVSRLSHENIVKRSQVSESKEELQNQMGLYALKKRESMRMSASKRHSHANERGYLDDDDDKHVRPLKHNK